MARDGEQLFWDHVAPLLTSRRVEEGTIMSSPCIRLGGAFVAMPYHQGPGLVIKLPAGRVADLVAQGTGQPFAPAGRVFKEWVLVERHDAALWDALLDEALAFAESAPRAHRTGSD